MGLPVGVRTCKCEPKKRGHIFWMVSWCQKQLRSHVCATNVMLHYFDLTASRGSSSLTIAYARANPSLLWEKTKQYCLLGPDSPQGGSVCGHVTSVSALKCVPTPPSSTSLGVLLRGEDMSREICLICTNGLFFCLCLREIKRVYISQCFHNTAVCMDVIEGESIPLCKTVSLP